MTKLQRLEAALRELLPCCGGKAYDGGKYTCFDSPTMNGYPGTPWCKHCQAISLARQALSAPDDWLPIESAPKGEYILIGRAGLSEYYCTYKLFCGLWMPIGIHSDEESARRYRDIVAENDPPGTQLRIQKRKGGS